MARNALTGLGPVLFQLVLSGRKWDKENRIHWRLGRAVILPQASALLPSLPSKTQLENNSFGCPELVLYPSRLSDWPVNCPTIAQIIVPRPLSESHTPTVSAGNPEHFRLLRSSPAPLALRD